MIKFFDRLNIGFKNGVIDQRWDVTGGRFFSSCKVFVKKCKKNLGLFLTYATFNRKQGNGASMQGSEVTDETLLKDLRNNDPRAFETIYRRYWRQLFVFVYQQIGSKEDAKEILQDLMLSFWQNRAESNIYNLRSFLFIAARNLVNMHFRREINLRKYREYQLMQEVFESGEVDCLINEKDLRKAIDGALEKLPEKTASIFRMNKLDHVSINKIAVNMGLSDKAVEYHLTKSMKAVRKHLERFLTDN